MPIKEASLTYKDETSDKVYEVAIAYLRWGSYRVNFAYGRRGTRLKTGTKTKTPVSLANAEEIFDKSIESKKKKGYKISRLKNIYYPEILQLSYSERQAIVNTLKQQNTDNFVGALQTAQFNLQKDLTALDLSNTDLGNANLRDSDLSQTNLCGANLVGAKLRGVNCRGSQIDETTQIEPKWRSIWQLVESGGENRDLSGVDLSNVEVDTQNQQIEIYLTGANLENANLKGINLENCNLTDADFSDANLEDANLQGVNLGRVQAGDGLKVNENTRVDPEWEAWLHARAKI